MALLRYLPPLSAATNAEALFFLERDRLWGRGIGYIDVHLLASVSLYAAAKHWTRDKRLRATAEQLGLAYPEPDA